MKAVRNVEYFVFYRIQLKQTVYFLHIFKEDVRIKVMLMKSHELLPSSSSCFRHVPNVTCDTFRYPQKLENLTITAVFSVFVLDKWFINASHLKISGILIPPASLGFRGLKGKHTKNENIKVRS